MFAAAESLLFINLLQSTQNIRTESKRSFAKFKDASENSKSMIGDTKLIHFMYE